MTGRWTGTLGDTRASQNKKRHMIMTAVKERDDLNTPFVGVIN